MQSMGNSVICSTSRSSHGERETTKDRAFRIKRVADQKIVVPSRPHARSGYVDVDAVVGCDMRR